MESMDPHINALHAAYCEEAKIQLPMLPAYERWWFDAKQAGLTPEDVKMVMVHRRLRIKAGFRNAECTYLRNICGSEEAIANTMDEAATLRAKQRIKTVPPGKAEVLRATGRSAEPETQNVRSVAEVIKAMNKAINE